MEKERQLASIQKIVKIESIPDKDRIELATIQGWEVIIGKGEFKVGDLVVYFQYDTLLPTDNSDFEFLRKRCFLPAYNAHRIRNMKMAGVYSQGLVMPLSILPNTVKISESKDVTDILNVKKYDPELLRQKNSNNIKQFKGIKKFLYRFKFFRKLFVKEQKSYPHTVHKSSETNIQVVFDKLKDKDYKYYTTEKIEGSSSCFCIYKNKYQFFSHNVQRFDNDNSVWDKISKKYNMEKELKKYKKTYGQEIAILGEIVGPGVQGNIYGFSENEFFMFDVYNTKTGYRYDYDSFIDIALKLQMPTVPILNTNENIFNNFNSVKELLEFSNGSSVLANNVKREGLVYRHMTKPDIGFKVKSPDYNIWFNKKHSDL